MNPFWASAAIPDSRTLDNQCRMVVERLRDSPPDPPKAVVREAVHCIFSLARTSLPDVRANLFWPEVHRELHRRTGVELDADHLTRTLRRWLSESYSAQIDWEIHHKFVGLVFEQAGIGKDRNRIIARFLRDLVADPAFASDASAKVIATAALRRFEAELRDAGADELSDVVALKPVLIRAGIAVVDFAAFIRDMPDRWKLQKMSWDKVKALWQESSGIDPDTLTPSARDVLAGIVSELVSVLTRKEAYRRVAASGIRIRLPGGDLLERAVGGALNLPLGPAEIIGPTGTVTVQLLDDESLPVSVVARLERDIWHTSGDLRYRISDKPFSLNTASTRKYSAVPFYLGQSAARAQLGGFYLGLEAEEDGIPEPAETGNGVARDGVRKPRLTVQTRLVVDQKANVGIWINGFRCHVPDGNASLMVDDEVVWKGDVRDDAPVKWRGIRIPVGDSAIDGGMRIRLVAGNESYERRISLPVLRQPVVVVVGSRIVAPYDVVPIEANETVRCFVFDRGDARPEVSSGSAGDPEDAELAGRSCVKVDVSCFAGGAESTSLSFRGRVWTFVRSVPFTMVLELPQKRVIDGVEVSGVAGARLLEPQQGVTALVSPAVRWTKAPGHLSLHIAGGVQSAIPVPASAMSPCGDSWRLDIRALLEEHGIPLGPFSFAIGAWDSEPDDFVAVIPVRSIERIPGKVEEHSRLAVNFDGGESRQVLSRDVVSLAALNGMSPMVGRVTIAGGEIWFTWSALVEDIVLANRSGVGCDYRIALRDIPESGLTARLVSTADTVWNVRVGYDSFVARSGEDLDLTTRLAAVDVSQAAQDLRRVVATSTRSTIQWLVDCTPSFTNFSAALDRADEGMPAVVVTGVLKGLAPCSIGIRISAGAEDLGEGELPLRPGEWAFAKPVEIRIPVSSLNIESGAQAGPLIVRVSSGPAVVASGQIEVASVSRDQLPGPAQLGKKIKAALAQYRVTGDAASAESALAWTADYVARFGKMPFGISALLAPVLNSAAGRREASNAVLADALRLLDALTGNARTEVAFARSDNSAARFIRVMRASLAMFHQHSLSEAGLTDPALVGRIRAELEELSDAGGAWDVWCRNVLAFAGHFVAGARSAIQQPRRPPTPSEGLVARLAGIYRPFAAWLEMESETV